MIWIRFLTNSVEGNCEHAFSYCKNKFFINSHKHPTKMHRAFKRKSFVFEICIPRHFGPGVLIKHSTWALVTNSDLCGKGFLWFSMLPANSTFTEKPCLRIIIWKCNDGFFNFYKKTMIIKLAFSWNVKILDLFMKILNEKPYLIMKSLILHEKFEWENGTEEFCLISRLRFR